MRKRYYSLVLAGLMLLGISGCQKGREIDVESAKRKTDSTEMKIAFWGASGEEEALKKAMDGVEDEVGNISIEWEQYPSVEEFYNVLPTEAAIGKIPDIVMLNNEEQRSLVEGGIVEALNFVPDSALYVENVLDEWTYQGKLYGIPQTAAPAMLIINEEMWKESGLSEYPDTWDQVYEDAKVLKEHGYMPICIDISNMYHVTQYFLAFGGGWNKGENLATEENCSAIEYILKMFDEGLAVTAQDMGKTWDGEVFASRQCAMSTGGTWYIGALKAVSDISYVMLPLPRTEKGSGKTMHSYGFSVMKGCRNKELAEDIVEYLTREEAQEIRMQVTGDCPALLSLQEAYYQLYPELVFIQNDLKNTRSFDYPTDLNVLDQVKEKMKARIYGKNPELTPEEILSS